MEEPLRRVASVWEVDGVSDAKPWARILHRWNEADDSFDVVDSPSLLSVTAAELADRAAKLRTLAVTGQTSADALASLLAG
jgi:hypothetical protein